MSYGQIRDRVCETTTTTGTGTVTLAGALGGYRSFSSAYGGNANVYYVIEDGTNWEVGLGTFTNSGTTLARTTVIASSNAGAAVNFPGGAQTRVFNALNASRFSSKGVYALTDAVSGTVAIDASIADDFRLVTTGGPSSTRKLGNPTNMIDGQKITIRVKLGAASDAITYDTKWKLLGVAGTFPATSGSIYVVSGQYDATDDTIVYGAQPSA